MNVLTIAGPPKSGKTRLAITLAAHLAGLGYGVTVHDSGDGRAVVLGLLPSLDPNHTFRGADGNPHDCTLLFGGGTDPRKQLTIRTRTAPREKPEPSLMERLEEITRAAFDGIGPMAEIGSLGRSTFQPKNHAAAGPRYHYAGTETADPPPDPALHVLRAEPCDTVSVSVGLHDAGLVVTVQPANP